MRIEEFTTLPPAELRALAASAHVVCVPPGRALVTRARATRDYLYLLKGAVCLEPGSVRLRAPASGRIRYFYPGCEAVRTLTHCQVLRIDARHREFILQRGSPALQAARSERWLARFLSSHMMRRLAAWEWQRLLKAFHEQRFAPRQSILRQGAPGQHCYVIESGHVVVHDDVKTLAHLNPGDFFGEEALLLGAGRSAHVTALDEVCLQAITAPVFADVLVDSLIRFVAQPLSGQHLNLDALPRSAAQTVAQHVRRMSHRLEGGEAVYILGGAAQERALAAFLLIQRGFRAYPVTQAAARVPLKRVQSGPRPSCAAHEYSLPATLR